jgi:hypothetical protein
LDKDIFPLISLPEKLVVDGGSCLLSPKFKSFFNSLGVEVLDNIAYQPEWLGTVETVNRVVRYALTKTCQDSFNKWDKYLPGILWGLRCKISSATGYSPYFLLFGVQPRIASVGTVSLVNKVNVESRIVELESLPGLRKSLETVSRSSSKVPVFAVGEFVLLLKPNLRKGTVVNK